MKCCICCTRCSRELAAFIFATILSLFLLAAVAGPWYLIVVSHIPTGRGTETETMRYLFWWRGVLFAVDDENGNERSQDWIDWADMSSGKPVETYMISVGLALLALGTTALLSLLLIFGFLLPTTRLRATTFFKGKSKWVVNGIAFLPVAFIIVSFSVFITFPSALEEAGFCPREVLPFSLVHNERLWCSSFTGNADFDIIAPEPSVGSATSARVVSVSATWFPFVSWVGCVIAVLWAIVTFGFTLSIKKDPEYDSINDW